MDRLCGEILFCETTPMPGKGNIQLTGLLGEVMKESARIALSTSNPIMRIRNTIMPLTSGIYCTFSRSTTKDVPRQGFPHTALASAHQRPVRHDIAMTGEVTAR